MTIMQVLRLVAAIWLIGTMAHTAILLVLLVGARPEDFLVDEGMTFSKFAASWLAWGIVWPYFWAMTIRTLIQRAMRQQR